MADTIQTVITAVQRRLTDLQTSRALDLADIVHREVMAQIPELRRVAASAPVQINLVAGTKEYSISEYLMQVDFVQYRTGSGVATKLLETNIETLNKTQPTWRQDATGVPSAFYISSDASGNGVIGLVPTPSASTSGGYPIVELFGSTRNSTALVLTDTVPATLFSSQLYVEGICYYASMELRPSAAAAFKATYQEQLILNREYNRSRNEGLKTPPFANERGG